MKNLSVIQTMCGAEPDKICHLSEVMQILKDQMLPEYELLFVEQASREYPLWKGFCELVGARHIFIGDPEKYPLYRRGWMRNVGVRQADSPMVLFIGDDIIFGPDYISGLLDSFQSEYKNGSSRILFLSARATTKYLSGREYGVQWDGRDIVDIHRVEDNNSWGSVVLFDRDFYLNKLGGENEEYQGWGSRDRDLHGRCMSITGKDAFFPSTHLHLWHQRGEQCLEFAEQNGQILISALTYPRETTALLVEAGVGRLDQPVAIPWQSLRGT